MNAKDESIEVYDYKNIMRILGIGNNKAYQLLKSKSFAGIKIVGSYKVSKQVFNKWLNKLYCLHYTTYNAAFALLFTVRDRVCLNLEPLPAAFH